MVESELKLRWTIAVAIEEDDAWFEEDYRGASIYYCAAWCPIGVVARVEERRMGHGIRRLFRPGDATRGLGGGPLDLSLGTLVGDLCRGPSPISILYDAYADHGLP